VRASLPDHDAADRPSASVAGSIRAPIHREPLGVRTRLAIGSDEVADARASVQDPLAEHLPHGPMKAPHVGRIERVRSSQRLGKSATMRARNIREVKETTL